MSYKIVATQSVNAGGVEVHKGDVLAEVPVAINLNVLQQMVRMGQAVKVSDGEQQSPVSTGTETEATPEPSSTDQANATQPETIETAPAEPVESKPAKRSRK